MESNNNRSFNIALKYSNWLIADGVGVVIGYSLLSFNRIFHITGYDLFIGLSESLNKSGSFNVFFLGSKQEVLTEIIKKYSKQFPNLNVVGSYSPPYKEEFTHLDLIEMSNKINNSNVDVLWVGLTAPKQELVLYNLRKQLNVRFASGIGAVFDYYIGNVTRAPFILRKVGLEWLFRFLQEPRRLFKRNFISTPVFIFLFLKELFLHRFDNKPNER